MAGNHDLKNISEEELATMFNQKSLYFSFDSRDYHFVVLYTKSLEHKDAYLSKKQIDWLKNDLGKTAKKTIIFSHYSLADQDLTGNPWFENSPEYCLVVNRNEIRDIFFASKKVIAVFNGHLHWDKLVIHDNIPYFTIQSLTENEDNKGIASETHAIVNIEDNKVNVDIRGKYPKTFLGSRTSCDYFLRGK